MDYKIIAFSTNDKKYISYYNSLLLNLNRIKYLDYKLDIINDLNLINNKLLACLYKPTFILKSLLLYQKPILYIDIDSVIDYEKYTPIKINKPTCCWDVGFVFTPERKNKVSDSIHLWNYSADSIKFLKLWKEECEDLSHTTIDHHRLIKVLDSDDLNTENIRNQISPWYSARFSSNNKILKY